MDFEPVIGIEIHAQLKTKSKMFSSAPVNFGDRPNSNVAPLDIAFPGALPTVNKEAIIYAIRVCHALNMKIDDLLVFDRKNYFYSDLPKGYQLTQYFRPIGKDGYLTLKSNNFEKKIGIERLHIEEDTCKQIHESDYSLLDYNRSGIPLLEIVSLPEISNGLEAQKFVEEVRSILTFLDVSDGKMENGSLRCDVNVSLSEKGSNILGTKVEIKNLNSFSNIQRAIDFEIDRQKSLLLDGKKLKQETRRFDENRQETVLMRVKVDDVDYKYFTDPNIVPIRLSEAFIKKAIEDMPELASSKVNRYLSYGLNEYDANLLVSSKEISDFFDEGIKTGVNPKSLANWIIHDVFSYLNKEDINIKESKVNALNLCELISFIDKNEISNKQARDVFAKMTISGHTAKEIILENNMSQMNDEKLLSEIVNKVIDNNPKVVVDYKSGIDHVVGYIVGQVMKETKGKANPSLANKLILKELKRR